jgi:nicotinamidase-related amidase
MPLNPLDSTAALIVVDLQVGTTSAPTAHPADLVIANVLELVASFRAAGRPIVVGSVDGTPAGKTVYGGGVREFPAPFADLVPGVEGDIVAPRRTWSVFAGTEVHERLAEKAVTQVVIVGLATSFGVESTARAAYDLGYSVVIVTDAITDRSLESHDNSIARVFPALGEIATTTEVLESLTV